MLIKFDPTVGVQLAFLDLVLLDLITTVRVQVRFETSHLVKFGDIWTLNKCCSFKAVRVERVFRISDES